MYSLADICVTLRQRAALAAAIFGSLHWPDFFNEAIELKGKPVGEIVIEGGEDPVFIGLGGCQCYR